MLKQRVAFALPNTRFSQIPVRLITPGGSFPRFLLFAGEIKVGLFFRGD